MKTSLCCNFWLIVTIVVAAVSCKEENNYTGLAVYPDVREVFTESEIQDLDTIVHFFERQICDLLMVRSPYTEHCYQELFRQMEIAFNTKNLYVPVSFDAQQTMYSRLSGSTFNAIWLREQATDYQTGETYERIMPNDQGRYVEFLDNLKTEHLYLESYVQSLRTNETIVYTAIDAVMINYRRYDLSDLRIRLFLAVHYLTLNDISVRRNAR